MNDWGTFLTGMVGSRPIEITAVMFGLMNITLLIRRSIWNYPFGIVMVCLYMVIFYQTKLYSDVILQVFFLFAQIYGWYYWSQRRDDDGLVIVGRLGAGMAVVLALGGAALLAVIGTLMSKHTDAAAPYWDASILVFSVIAQILLARRLLENWLVWIFVDILAIGLYWSKGLYPTAALYTVFLILATFGYIAWRRSWKQGVPAA